MSLIARMIIPISVIVTLATSFIGWKAYSDARDSVAEATRILEISTLDAVGRELTTVMNLTRQHLLTVADRIAIIDCSATLMNPPRATEQAPYPSFAAGRARLPKHRRAGRPQ